VSTKGQKNSVAAVGYVASRLKDPVPHDGKKGSVQRVPRSERRVDGSEAAGQRTQR
jgi:hypothetical protein